MDNYPRIIQGGMGAGVSDWRLARAVSGLGQLGVVSGTAIDHILARAKAHGVVVGIHNLSPESALKRIGGLKDRRRFKIDLFHGQPPEQQQVRSGAGKQPALTQRVSVE